jgi:hypothetical protein
MFDRTRLSRLIALALASCAVTSAFAAGAMARPADDPTVTAGPAPVYKAVPGDTDKAPSASTAPAYQPAIGDRLKAPDRAVVDRNLASIGRGPKTTGVVVATDDNTDTIALITAIAAMLVALAAVTFIVIRPQQGPVMRA